MSRIAGTQGALYVDPKDIFNSSPPEDSFGPDSPNDIQEPDTSPELATPDTLLGTKSSGPQPPPTPGPGFESAGKLAGKR